LRKEQSLASKARWQRDDMQKIVLFSVAICLVACTSDSADVRYNFDREAEFSRFRTYTWVILKDAAKIDDLRDKQIKDATDGELAKKGLARTDADSADLYVGYQVAIDKETQFTSYKTDWGYSPGWSQGNQHRGVGGATTGQTSTIYTGQLALDMYDPKNHRLVWRGVASKAINPNARPDKQQSNLAKAIAKLLKNYPPTL